MDNFFINALVRASLCRYHSSLLPIICSTRGSGGPISNRPSPHTRTISTTYRNHHRTILETSPPPKYSDEIKTELKSFTDPYYDPETDHPPPLDETKAKALLREKQTINARALPWITPAHPQDQESLQHFLTQLDDPTTSLENLFKSYRLLPHPHIPHLTLLQVDKLVSLMMTVPHRDEIGMLRYLSILDDLKSAQIPISRNEYNAAVSFVARSFKSVTVREAQSAIQLWQESETIAGIPSDTTTFNILLDMAAKSDTPILAQWVLREMETRDIQPDRFTYTTLITYYGLRSDAEGVRSSYRALVDSGEIVDTVVLNAVMTALLRVREPQAAEYIYENMKRSHLDIQTVAETGPKDWKGKRAWAKNLKHIAAKRRVIKDYMKDFNASLAPDIYTFNMLILQSSRVGDYDHAMVLFGEMGTCGIVPDETVFVALLKGFYWYGGMRYSPWTKEKLDMVIRMVFEEGRGVVMERSLANWVVRSVAKVYNSKEKVLQAWEMVGRRWKAQGGVVDEECVEVLRGLVGRSTGGEGEGL